MAEKTYKSVQPRFSTYCFKDGKRIAIQFVPHLHGGVHGEFTTADEVVQKFIETRDAFKSGLITIKTADEHAADKKTLESKVASGAADKAKHAQAHAAHAKAHAERTEADKVVQIKNTDTTKAQQALKDAHMSGATEKANVAKKAEAAKAVPVPPAPAAAV